MIQFPLGSITVRNKRLEISNSEDGTITECSGDGGERRCRGEGGGEGREG